MFGFADFGSVVQSFQSLRFEVLKLDCSILVDFSQSNHISCIGAKLLGRWSLQVSEGAL